MHAKFIQIRTLMILKLHTVSRQIHLLNFLLDSVGLQPHQPHNFLGDRVMV
ncbi:unnamed protein product [Brassica napus]|uniref:(rape) hypothetical protein n=1 Tax=Brassica napus TaxID=3708 RepID=A0A816Q7H8_BRANA|nr:unnamed protein product [Brassica napus]